MRLRIARDAQAERPSLRRLMTATQYLLTACRSTSCSRLWKIPKRNGRRLPFPKPQGIWWFPLRIQP